MATAAVAARLREDRNNLIREIDRSGIVEVLNRDRERSGETIRCPRGDGCGAIRQRRNQTVLLDPDYIDRSRLKADLPGNVAKHSVGEFRGGEQLLTGAGPAKLERFGRTNVH